jgi:hypothetical protein
VKQEEGMKVCQLRREALVLTGAVLLAGAASAAAAQPAVEAEPETVARSFNELKSRVQFGGTLFVTDAADLEVSGKLSELSDESLDLLVDGKLQQFVQGHVKVIKRRQPDSLWNGLLIGAAAGAVPAVYWLFADPNECAASICMDDLVIGVIPGAVIGLAIDLAVQKKVIVYRRPSQSSKGPALTVTPLVAQHRTGIGLTIFFSSTPPQLTRAGGLTREVVAIPRVPDRQ